MASPGSVKEAFFLASEMLSLVWHFQTPGILLTEKHMSESRLTVDIDVEKSDWPDPLMHNGEEYNRYLDTSDGISPLLFPPSKHLIKWDSYEHDESGITTEDPDLIVMMHDKRRKKAQALLERMKKMRTVNLFGSSGPLIFAYGSTTMSVLEALRVRNIEAMVVQPVYLEPLPVWEFEGYRGSDAIVVEQSASGQFASLLKEKAGIDVKAVVKKYDGRPFEPVELAGMIGEVI